MNTKTLTAVALILVTIPVLGWAQADARAPRQMPLVDFAAADTDASGGISAAEWTAYVEAHGAANRSEMRAARVDALLTAADTNGDGMLDRDELLAGFEAMRGGDEFRRRGDTGRRNGHHGHGARGGYGQDRDQDQRRGMMEPGAGAARAFDRIDANGDGQIDANELAAMQERMQERMQRRMGRQSN